MKNEVGELNIRISVLIKLKEIISAAMMIFADL